MACPTCNHTIQRIIEGTFWCPRCGTLLTVEGENNKVEAPTLVIRCRQFENDLTSVVHTNRWQTLGIQESIWPDALINNPKAES